MILHPAVCDLLCALEPRESLYSDSLGLQNQQKAFRPLRCEKVNDLSSLTLAGWASQGEVYMSGQVVLYFEDQADALRFALAAGSVMSGEGGKFTSDLVEETARVTRIRLDAVNGVGSKKPTPERAA